MDDAYVSAYVSAARGGGKRLRASDDVNTIGGWNEAAFERGLPLLVGLFERGTMEALLAANELRDGVLRLVTGELELREGVRSNERDRDDYRRAIKGLFGRDAAWFSPWGNSIGVEVFRLKRVREALDEAGERMATEWEGDTDVLPLRDIVNLFASKDGRTRFHALDETLLVNLGAFLRPNFLAMILGESMLLEKLTLTREEEGLLGDARKRDAVTVHNIESRFNGDRCVVESEVRNDEARHIEAVATALESYCDRYDALGRRLYAETPEPIRRTLRRLGFNLFERLDTSCHARARTLRPIVPRLRKSARNIREFSIF